MSISEAIEAMKLAKKMTPDGQHLNDPESAHLKADEVLIDLLESMGGEYAELAVIWKSIEPKWYA